MLIKLMINNFLSFNETQEFSMLAGKARKHSERIYRNNSMKLTKCKAVFGSNASGKSNLVEALGFIQTMVEDGFPRGFTNKYYRQELSNKTKPSEFEIQILIDSKIYSYGFSVVLKDGEILKEWLYEILQSGTKRKLFYRDLKEDVFEVGDYFKEKESIFRIRTYGEDTISDHEDLFLTIISKNKSKMFEEMPELKILRRIYNWFVLRLTISNPASILTGYPYFSDSNLEEISEIMNALGTGISDLKIVDVSLDTIKNSIPEDVYNKIIKTLEKENVKAKKQEVYNSPSIVARSYKSFYTFEIDRDDNVSIKTIEFSHEKQDVYFELYEESDGTARLLDLIEILLNVSKRKIFVIDEIDRCLHPAMTVKIIELFLIMAKKRDTQLIVTSHESRLLVDDMLRNDEICFMLKTMDGESIINPLEKYQLRADKKVYAALFDGTIDAMPQFDMLMLEKLIEKANLTC